MSPELIGVRLADSPERWAQLGFAVDDGVCSLGGLSLVLGAPGAGITGWALTGVQSQVDGLPNTTIDTPSPPARHPNGAVGVDHIVVVTPEFERTKLALEEERMPLRRIVARPDGNRMGFRRLGPAILELVEVPDGEPGPARFWGLVVVVGDLDALASRLGDRLGSIRDAVQPGRRIATLRESAALGQAVAFMSPEPG